LKRYNYYKYYRVNQEDTAVIEISANDFKVPETHGKASDRLYTLLPVDQRFYLFTDISRAMEKAKANAQRAINELIDGGEKSLPKLLQYRMDHYEDLHVNLVDANIQKTEDEMKADSAFTWYPYKIHT